MPTSRVCGGNDTQPATLLRKHTVMPAIGVHARDRLPQSSPTVFLLSYPKAGRTWLRALVGKALVEHYGLPEAALLDTSELTRAAGLPIAVFDHDQSDAADWFAVASDSDRSEVRIAENACCSSGEACTTWWCLPTSRPSCASMFMMGPFPISSGTTATVSTRFSRSTAFGRWPGTYPRRSNSFATRNSIAILRRYSRACWPSWARRFRRRRSRWPWIIAASRTCVRQRSRTGSSTTRSVAGRPMTPSHSRCERERSAISKSICRPKISRTSITPSLRGAANSRGRRRQPQEPDK